MILIISHGNGRSGAPISLLNLSKILKKNGYDLFFISKDDDVLTSDFEELGPLSVWHRPWIYEPNIIKRIWKRMFGGNKYRQNRIVRKLSKKKIDLVINNTITNGDILKALAPLNLKVVTWVHEMETVIQIYKAHPNELVNNTFKYSAFFWAASNSVKVNLINNHNVNPQKIKVVYEIINEISGNNDILKTTIDLVSLKREGDFIVGGCGQNGWRKGTDLFLKTASYLSKEHPELNIRFLWIGGQPNISQYIEFKREITLLNLENIVTIIPNANNVIPFFKLMDVFVLTSREDPFPLTMLEAGSLKIPILGFKKSGGIEELINCEYLVNYSDCKGLAEKVIELYKDPVKRQKTGETNKKNCEKFQIQYQEPVMLTLVLNLIKNNRV